MQYKANTDLATITAAIAGLTDKGRDTMRAIGNRETSFFDNGIVTDSGIWGDNLTGELGHKSSGVINRLRAVGLLESHPQSGDDPSDWWTLTALGADVANYLAGNLDVDDALPFGPDHNCVPTPEEPVSEPETAEETAQADFTAEPLPQAERAADATYAARGNYNTVWVPAALVLADGFEGVDVWSEKVSTMLVNVHMAGPRAVVFLRHLEASVESAQTSLRAWQKTQDRDGQTEMQKYNANRSFLAGYLAAVTGAKKLPVIAFAKDMERATVLDAVKAGVAARKAEAKA
jgi:hypothetical protein